VWKLLFYCPGEGANSLVTNGLFGFAMLFYTDALGLPATLAATALSMSVFWEAVSEPAMGYISDRTRTRWGARFPWILGGGLAMSMLFVAVWIVPSAFRANQLTTFAYLVAANLLLRTALTVFFVPYMAVGFELVPTYNGRSRLQAVRQVANMAANFCGPALAWSVFFHDSVDHAGHALVGTRQAANYLHMGIAFGVCSAICVLLVVLGNRSQIKDNRASALRQEPKAGPGIALEFKLILGDRHAQRIFLLTFLACAAMVIVSSMQGYLYVYFMGFAPNARVVAHGGTMVAMAVGGASSAFLSARLDKKGAAALGALMGASGAGGLGLAFLPGWIERSGVGGLCIFVGLEGLFWLGSGIVLPILTAMIGDASDLARHRCGHSLDGGYASTFTVATRLAISFSIMASGWLLGLIGFDPAHAPSAAAIWRLGATAFAGGGLVYLVFLWPVLSYPLDRRRYEQELANPSGQNAALAHGQG